MAMTRRGRKGGVPITVALIGLVGIIIGAWINRPPAEANVQAPAAAAAQPQQPPAELEQVRERLRAAAAERDRLRRERDGDRAARKERQPAPEAPRHVKAERREEGEEAPRLRRPQRREEEEAPRLRRPERREEEEERAAEGKVPKLYEVSVTVEMANVRLHGCNPLLTRSETVTVRAGGQTLTVEVDTHGRTAVGTLRLPEGTHKFVATARAEGKWWPGSGHQPRQSAVSGRGAGDLVVRGDTSFVLHRSPSRDGGYQIQFKPAW
jgi:hypothetical protein